MACRPLLMWRSLGGALICPKGSMGVAAPRYSTGTQFLLSCVVHCVWGRLDVDWNSDPAAVGGDGSGWQLVRCAARVVLAAAVVLAMGLLILIRSLWCCPGNSALKLADALLPGAAAAAALLLLRLVLFRVPTLLLFLGFATANAAACGPASRANAADSSGPTAIRHVLLVDAIWMDF